MISADTLPLKGWQTASAGQLLLRSTCWSVSSHRPDKEGASFGEVGVGEWMKFSSILLSYLALLCLDCPVKRGRHPADSSNYAESAPFVQATVSNHPSIQFVLLRRQAGGSCLLGELFIFKIHSVLFSPKKPDWSSCALKQQHNSYRTFDHTYCIFGI